MILYELGPFVKLCQFCGVFPFQINFDGKTKNFKGLECSRKHFFFWWFLAVFLWQIASPVVGGLFIVIYAKEKPEDIQRTPVPVLVFSALSGGILYFILFSLRWSALRFSALKRVLSYFNQADIILACRHKSQNSSPVNSRITSGSVVAIFSVS